MLERQMTEAIFGSIGPTEVLVILFIVLILFGVGKLPQVGGALGRGIRNFKDAAVGKDEPPAKNEPKESAEDKKA